MYKEILMQVADDDTKIAVLEEGNLVEIYIEREPDKRLVGNIYKGVVRNVLPGMQAAFVDIGLEKNAFLYVDDALAYNNWQENGVSFALTEGIRPNIRDIIKEGQEIVVQISKEAVGNKGARVTTQLTVPGRYLVLMPTVDYIGISKRITSDSERERLKGIAEEIKPECMGIIIRTVAEGASHEDLEQDIDSLMKICQRIKQRIQQLSGPAMIHKDLALVQRILRDVFADDVQKLSVNSRVVMEKVIDYLDVMDVSLKNRVFLSDTVNLFEKYAIDQEINQALKRKVWLKSGGYLVIDETEALTAFDVNTGKFVGSTDLADTVLKTNTEAAIEISRQIRLRNIGGIIIVDFIDMQNSEHREKILRIIEEKIKADKMKVHVLGITQLGLVEMTRKKVGHSLSSILEKKCPLCEGKGKILSEETVCIRLKKDLRNSAAVLTADTLVVTAHPLVNKIIVGQNGCQQHIFEEELGVRLVLKDTEQHSVDGYSIAPLYQEGDTED
ncbi:MAG: ribonuclease G [Firmicutes bacterium HGW-Firmicutes-12]|jgi:ribonuclease G|nr:MAG: ribonuclease G [Firmicutes bacterium HGW-Firmicutes-12]